MQALCFLLACVASVVLASGREWDAPAGIGLTKKRNDTFLKAVERIADKVHSAAKAGDMPGVTYLMGKMAMMYANLTQESVYFLGLGVDSHGWSVRGGKASLVIGGFTIRSPFSAWNHGSYLVPYKNLGGRLIHMDMPTKIWRGLSRHRRSWVGSHPDLLAVTRSAGSANEWPETEEAGCAEYEARSKSWRDIGDELEEDEVHVVPLTAYCRKANIPVLVVRVGLTEEDKMILLPSAPPIERMTLKAAMIQATAAKYQNLPTEEEEVEAELEEVF